MRKGTILDASNRNLKKVGGKHVIIERDETHAFNPLTDQDNLFYLHSNITREFCANESEKGYPGLPIVEVEDEDGCGTGEYREEEDAVLFPVAAYIHSGIALSLGSGSHFPDQQWDVTRHAAWMWTNKERFEQLIGEGMWMHVYDEKARAWRPAKDEEEFRSYLWDEAKALLDVWQRWNDGEVYGYRTETSYVPYKKVYPDGEEEDEVDWEDGTDSCWGFIVTGVNDIDFPRGNGWEVYDATGDFVGDEYDIPEFVVTKVDVDGNRWFLSSYESSSAGTDAKMWSRQIADARVFDSFGECQRVAEAVIGKDAILVREMYNPNSNCVERSSIHEDNVRSER